MKIMLIKSMLHYHFQKNWRRNKNGGTLRNCKISDFLFEKWESLKALKKILKQQKFGKTFQLKYTIRFEILH